MNLGIRDFWTQNKFTSQKINKNHEWCKREKKERRWGLVSCNPEGLNRGFKIKKENVNIKVTGKKPI